MQKPLLILFSFLLVVTAAQGAPASGTFPAPFVARQRECERAQAQAYFEDVSPNALRTSRTRYAGAVKKFNAETEALRAQGVTEAHLPKVFTHDKPTRGVMVLIHGISESPAGMNELAEVYYEQGFNVVTVLLEGHGTTPQDLANVTDVKRWQGQVDRAIQEARDLGDKVMLGGFSFGGSLAIEAAVRNPGAVQGLALHAPVIEYYAPNADPVRKRAAEGEFWASANQPEEGPIFDQYRYRRTPTAPFMLTDNFVNGARPRWLSKKIPVPIYVITAPVDRMADPVATQAFIDAQGIPPERQLVIPKGRHYDANRSTKIDFDSYGLPEFIGRMLPK